MTNLVCVEHIEFAPGGAQPETLVQLPMAEIVYIENGMGLLRTDCKTLAVSAGDLFVFSIQTPHAFAAFSHKPLLARRISFLPSVLLRDGKADKADWFDFFAENQILHLSLTAWQIKSIAGKYDELRTETTQKLPDYQQAVRLQMNLLLLTIKRLHAGAWIPQLSSERKAAVLVTDVIQLIHEYYSDPSFSLKVASDILYRTSSSISRSFSEITGTYFSDYLRTYRMQRASVMLMETSRSIDAIAALCGYRDVSTFYKQFHYTLGVTPGSFRKQFQLSSEKDVSQQTPDA